MRVAGCWLLLFVAAAPAARSAPAERSAGRAPVPSQIVEAIDDADVVRLAGNTHPLARPEFDQGLVDPSLPMEGMLLILRRSAAQQKSLDALMAAQLDAKSASFHRWLEPQEFGALYGPSEQDVLSIEQWLLHQGLKVDGVSSGRIFIVFSGTARQVQQAFHTEIHRYEVHGERHIANSADPSIPRALQPAVVGVRALHDFLFKPLHVGARNVRRDRKTGLWRSERTPAVQPLYTGADGSLGFPEELVSPYDFAAIYDVLPLWNQNIDGSGETIAIAGRSDISLADVAAFRAAFGLPAKAPSVILNGPDPGEPSEDDRLENTLDVEWSGAVAKGATIKFVTTQSTSTSDGAFASALYIVDNKVASIMSFSYGECEFELGQATNAAVEALWQQGAAEGITEFVASGDDDAAACDGGSSAPYEAEGGLAVEGTSSTPYDTAVGGTDLNWANNSGTTYWSASNSANGSSALGYMPEVPWNSTCASNAIEQLIGAAAAGLDAEQTCQYLINNEVDLSLVNVVGGTGGKSSCIAPTGSTPSTCTGGYAKPSWQSGTGVPADGARDVPDVSLFASAGGLNSAYLICDSELGLCDLSSDGDALAQSVGGTSVASPAMAGIMALVLQKVGGVAQGLINPVLYQLAAADNLARCRSSAVAPGNQCSFYDITTDDIAAPCKPGSANCTVHHNADTVGILTGYAAGAGYDLATGLGSVNAANLVDHWPTINDPATVSLSPTSLTFAATAAGASSAAQTVTVANTGSGALAIHRIALIGGQPDDFVLTTMCGSALAAGATCSVSITFLPVSAGIKSASISIADNASGSPQPVALRGTATAATAAPAVTLSLASLTFGPQTAGTSAAAQTVIVTNSGTASLAFSSIAVTGAQADDFLLSGTCGSALAAAASCSVSITFKPVSAGIKSARISIADNAMGSPQIVALRGVGEAAAPAPAVQLNPTSLTFGVQPAGTSSAAQTVTVSNSGNAPLTFSSIAVTGEADDFLTSATCESPLAAAASCSVSVIFKPVSAGSKSAKITVADNAGGTPQIVTLSGTGS